MTKTSGRRHGRLPWPTRDELDPARREVHDRLTGGPRAGASAVRMVDDDGRLHGPFNIMVAAPGPGRALSDLGAALRFGTTLSARARGIATLTLAVLQRASFMWYANRAGAAALGLTDADLAAISELTPSRGFDDSERVVQRAVIQLVVDGDLDDEVHALLESHLGTEGVVELVVLVGYYRLLALAMRALRTPLPDGEPDPFPDLDP